jgi:murein L,D-transpeptidase YcbB/YkuD
MEGFRLTAAAFVGAVGLAALGAASPLAASETDDFSKLSGKNFTGKQYATHMDRRSQWRRQRNDGGFYSEEDRGGFFPFFRFVPRQSRRDNDGGFPRFFAPQKPAVSTYKSKSPDAGFGTYVPPKLVQLHDPLPDAIKPYRVLASSVLHELRNADTAVRVSESQRNAIVSFYKSRSFEPLWVTSEGLNEKARRVLAHMALAEEHGLNAADYVPAALGSFDEDGSVFRGDITHLARLELSVTAATVRYAQHAYGGRIVPRKMSGYYDLTPPQLDVASFLGELSWRVVPDVYLAGLHPSHPAYAVMKSALAELRKKAEDEEEPIATGARVKVGERDGRVPLVRARLAKLGHLKAAEMPKFGAAGSKSTYSPTRAEAPEAFAEIAASEILDGQLSKALLAFQKSQSIKATGRIDSATVNALNQRPDGNKLQKLLLNMERLRWLPRELGDRHIFVNQAAFELRLMENDRISWQTKVIVGKPETQTYVFSDEMETVVMNPYWGVPLSIIQGEMMPMLAEDPYYLDREGYEVLTREGELVSSASVDWWAYGSKLPYDVRQPPGPNNALGYVKFLFPNGHDIYMHDTPTRKLFEESKRAFSHGCIRVENPRELAVRVLGWSREEVDAAIETGLNQNFELEHKIPVHINYFTAWPDPNGKIAYFSDGYKRDSRLEKALNTLTVAAN